ncbi:MAG: STAS domain-containing protein [Pseudonocardiales bacterium]
MVDFAVNQQRTDTGHTVLALVGELDLAGAAIMRTAGLAALGDPNCSTLVLDVTALTFLDSTGIGSWVELRNHAHQNGQHLSLRGASDNLSRILTIAGLTSLFDLEPPAR